MKKIISIVQAPIWQSVEPPATSYTALNPWQLGTVFFPLPELWQTADVSVCLKFCAVSLISVIWRILKPGPVAVCHWLVTEQAAYVPFNIELHGRDL